MALYIEEGTIKEICYRMFERGFNAEEIVKKKKYRRATVLYYRSMHRNEFIANQIKESRDESCMFSSYIKEFSKYEMDYGYEMPKYRFEDLTTSEKSLTRKKEHTHLKQIDYERSRLQHDSEQ